MDLSVSAALFLAQKPGGEIGLLVQLPGKWFRSDFIMIRPWNEIRARYAEVADAGSALLAMHKLVSEIDESEYKQGIFAWTSMHDLCIAQTPVSYPYNGPYLRISPLADGQLEFRYVDTEVKAKQWHRVVEGAAGFARLERFFKQLHWFDSGLIGEGEVDD